MDDRGKSILLQVAFKGAIAVGVPTAEQVLVFYELLTELHDRLGINPVDKPRGGGGGGRSNAPKAAQPTGETFILDGEMYTDFRKEKGAGTVNVNYPDFKRVSDDKPFWQYTQSGEIVEDTIPLVTARDTGIF